MNVDMKIKNRASFARDGLFSGHVRSEPQKDTQGLSPVRSYIVRPSSFHKVAYRTKLQ
jgi:hypothetical protein